MLFLLVSYEIKAHNIVIDKCKSFVFIYAWCFYMFLISFFLFNSAGVPSDDKNWPPFFPIIHHDIANEIPVHAQRLQYLAFASWLGMDP